MAKIPIEFFEMNALIIEYKMSQQVVLNIYYIFLHCNLLHKIVKTSFVIWNMKKMQNCSYDSPNSCLVNILIWKKCLKLLHKFTTQHTALRMFIIEFFINSIRNAAFHGLWFFKQNADNVNIFNDFNEYTNNHVDVCIWVSTISIVRLKIKFFSSFCNVFIDLLHECFQSTPYVFLQNVCLRLILVIFAIKSNDLYFCKLLTYWLKIIDIYIMIHSRK